MKMLLKILSIIRTQKTTFKGPYDSWSKAVKNSSGWQSKKIFDKTLSAALSVRDGKQAWEQDTVLRDEITYTNLIIAFLLFTLTKKSDNLHIVDFGGSLATNYYQLRKLLLFSERLRKKKIKWSIIEQKNIVDAGNEFFANENLAFHESTRDLLHSLNEKKSVDGLIFTGSFQYLADPFAELKQEVLQQFDVVAFDRLLVSELETDQIFTQHPDPKRYYDASYPVWAISKYHLERVMQSYGYHLIEQFDKSRVGEFHQVGLLFVKVEEI